MASAALQAVAILERDTNGDILPVWMFPSLDSKLKSVFRARSGLDSSEPTALASPFRFSKFSKHWLYQLSFPVSTTAQPKVSAASVCLVSSKFNPQKYQALLVLLVKAYADECSPLPVMQAFLDVTTTGKHGSFENGAFDDRRALLSPVVPLFKAFGMETILIWQAMLLRKRVFVFADKLEELLPLVRSFPLIGAWHRLDWSIVRPFVRVDNALEMEDLQKSGVYVAGFTQEEASNHRDLFDVFVNLSDSNITVAEHAKADFALTKYHKKLAGEFMEAASGGADQAVIKVVALKTKQLLSRLASLKDEDGRITEDGLREHELPVGMDRFLFNVAKAEKMT